MCHKLLRGCYISYISSSLNSVQTKAFHLSDTIDINLLNVQDFYWSSSSVTLAGIGVAKRLTIPRNQDRKEESHLFGDIELDHQNSETSISEEDIYAFAAFPFDPSKDAEVIIPTLLIKRSQTGETKLIYTGNEEKTKEELLHEIAQINASESDATQSNINIDSPIPPEVWRDEKITEIKEYIKEGSVKKVVLARELVLSAEKDFQISDVLEKLSIQNKSSMIFNIDGFLGASPELLIKRSGNSVMSHPLAGTAPRFSDEDSDQASRQKLLDSTKDAYEHQVTIEWLLNELLPFCSYVDADPEPKIVSLEHVHHLGTEVAGQLSTPPCSILELVHALHPTPAVGGDPQTEALAIIKKVEGINRKRYAGPVGWVSANGDGEFAVGIRSAEVKANTAHLFAGVGLVEDSDPQSELEETEAKFKTMLNTFLPTI